jgi:hypothetical protein
MQNLCRDSLDPHIRKYDSAVTIVGRSGSCRDRGGAWSNESSVEDSWGTA